MSCIELKVTQNLSCISAKVTRIGEGLLAQAKDVSRRLFAKTSCLSGLDVRCSVVCSLVDVGHYLDVTPAEIQWITDDIGVFFDVESNVEWKILID